jgi:N-acetylmuramoyl-L-alanine amidase
MIHLRRRDLITSALAAAVFGVGVASTWVSARAGQPTKKSAPRPAKPAAKPKPKPRLIALDPGHGGSDPGALGIGGTQEKTVVIAVARELQKQLVASGKYRVMLTRAADTLVPLRERVARAEAAKADLFLSIHADSHPDHSVRGASIYTLSEEASDREAEALAARENRGEAKPLPGAVARTLVAMAQRGTVNDSRRLADTVVRTFGQNGVRLLPRTHRQAGFAVLTSPDIPAALVELGYLSNPQDEKLLTVRQHQMALARALRASVEAYFAQGPATRKA